MRRYMPEMCVKTCMHLLFIYPRLLYIGQRMVSSGSVGGSPTHPPPVPSRPSLLQQHPPLPLSHSKTSLLSSQPTQPSSPSPAPFSQQSSHSCDGCFFLNTQMETIFRLLQIPTAPNLMVVQSGACPASIPTLTAAQLMLLARTGNIMKKAAVAMQSVCRGLVARRTHLRQVAVVTGRRANIKFSRSASE